MQNKLLTGTTALVGLLLTAGLLDSRAWTTVLVCLAVVPAAFVLAIMIEDSTQPFYDLDESPEHERAHTVPALVRSD